MKGTLFDLVRGSYVDGPGIRTTVFFKGCNLRCAWCHNPESQSAAPQMMFYKNKCTGCGKCKEKCPHALRECELCGKCALFCPSDAREICGKEYVVDEVMREILKDMPLYENTGGGVGEGVQYGSNDLVLDPITGKYVEYGTLLDKYYAVVFEKLQNGSYSDEQKKMIENYFALLYGGIKKEEGN